MTNLPTTPTATATPSSGLRLNPFAFPSNTDFLYALLIVLTFSLSLNAFHFISLASPIYSKPYFDGLTNCQKHFPLPKQFPTLDEVAQLAAQTNGDAEATLQLEQLQAAMQPQLNCTRAVQLGLLARTLALTAFVFLVAGLVYWFWPRWQMWRGKLQLLSEEDAPELPKYLQQCCAAVGLARQPQFVWNPLNPTRSAQAFGNLRQKYVALSGGLVSEFYAEREAFRAVLLHELAHHKNADVTKTYFGMALWYAFIVLAALPHFIVALIWGSRDIESLLSTLWQLGVVTALTLGLRNGILRQREHYADVRASVQQDASPALLRELQREQPASPLPQTGWRKWLSWWRVHPDVGLRQHVLQNTQPLFITSVALAFVTGLVTSTIMGMSQLVVGLYANSFETRALTLALPVTLILIGILGLGAWRSAFLALMTQRPPQPIWKQAAAFGAGLFLGNTLLFPNFAIRELLTTPLAWLGSTGNELLGAVLLAVLAWVVLSWLVDFASLWLGIAAKRASPRAVYLLGLGLAVVVVTPLCYVALVRQQAAVSLNAALAFMGLWQDVIENPAPLFPAYILFGLVPAAYLLWRRRAQFAGDASWSYLEPAATAQTNAHLGLLPQVHWRIVLRYALLAASVAGLAQLSIRAVDYFFIRGTAWDNAIFNTVFLAFMRGVALVQAAVAMLAARRAKDVPVIHALLVVCASSVLLTLLFAVWRIATQGVSALSLAALIGNFQTNVSFAALPAMLGCWLFLRRRV